MLRFCLVPPAAIACGQQFQVEELRGRTQTYRPRTLRSDQGRGALSGRIDSPDPVRELRLAGRARSHRLGPNQQVLEGYPQRRYYQGQRYIDQVESIVIERAKALFGADHANVQPYSGSPANLAVYFALLKPGDTLMGLALPH